jgi:hypothetical protein
MVGRKSGGSIHLAKRERAGGVAQTVEYLPSKGNATRERERERKEKGTSGLILF